jgi:hypothetical protein
MAALLVLIKVSVYEVTEREVGATFISTKVLINCVWRDEIHFKNALLLLVWSICGVISDAQTEVMSTLKLSLLHDYRCPPRKKLRVERLKAKLEPLLT